MIDFSVRSIRILNVDCIDRAWECARQHFQRCPVGAVHRSWFV